MKNKTCAQKPAHSSLAFQRKLPSSPIAINTIASCLSMSKNTGNYCSSTSASTALGIPFLKGVVHHNILRQELCAIHGINGSLGLPLGLVLYQGIAFYKPCLPVQVHVYVLDLPKFTEGLVQVLLLGLLMHVGHKQDPALHGRCGAHARAWIQLLELGPPIPLRHVGAGSVAPALLVPSPSLLHGILPGRLVLSSLHQGIV
mmetsp:Transcript_7168/g.19244  ORF Transcript_7168/g.19244 Transcript_7168/m.19244 type:complete len:201 (-) Transcript_7168:111-713(-)